MRENTKQFKKKKKVSFCHFHAEIFLCWASRAQDGRREAEGMEKKERPERGREGGVAAPLTVGCRFPLEVSGASCQLTSSR